ncbi:MAG TPA: type I-C CRISPR-associated endonuclease Cas1c [Chthoniobacterales bacterium]
MNVHQNTLYLITPGSYVSRDHLTLRVEVEKLVKLAVPIHHLESVCVFGPSTISPPALALCWEHGVAVNFLSEHGYFHARMTGVADTSVTLRRTQFRAADDPATCHAIARHIVAGKIQNSRNALLRAARENGEPAECERLGLAIDALARSLTELSQSEISDSRFSVDAVRGSEGIAAQIYFSVFTLMLKQQRADFAFTVRSRRPPLDRMNCLLSFVYALVRHDCIAALTSAGLDPFVGFLHVDRPNRPGLALDLMEEFRPWLADRLAVTLVNRQQISSAHFQMREGGAVELSEAGRKLVIKAYQERKQEELTHSLLQQNLRIGQLPFIQARILARTLRGDLPAYMPFVPK